MLCAKSFVWPVFHVCLYTGGEFTRKAEVTFLEGGEKATITQEFKGIDQHDHLLVDTQIEGRIPELPQGATVQIDPYTEIYLYSNNSEQQHSFCFCNSTTFTLKKSVRRGFLFLGYEI